MRVTDQIDRKLEKINEIGATPNYITTDPKTEQRLREEMDDNTEIASIGNNAPSSSFDAHTLTYRGLKVMVEEDGDARYLSIAYTTNQGNQEEL